MDEPDPELERELGDMEKVVAWRAVGLLDRGFKLDVVVKLAHKPDVLHVVDKLRARGCSIDFISDYLSD